MKFLTLTAFALVSMVFQAAAQVPVRPGDVKIDKIIPAVVKTPEYNITGGQNKRFTIGDWLEVEVEFTTAPEMISELTFNYKILINNQLLVGEVTHVNIPKGKEHFSVAYVSPRSLESVLKGKTLTSAAIQGIWVDCTNSGQLLHQLTTAPRNAAVPNVPQVQGMVLNKSLTPFALLYWDRYEALKPSR
jgi:hypothetical protein